MTDEKTDELPVREPEASFVDNPLPPQTSEYAGHVEPLDDADEVEDYGDGGPVSDEKHDHGHDPNVPHVHVLTMPSGMKVGELFGGLLGGLFGKTEKSELERELEETFPDVTIHVHVRTSWGKTYKADLNVPLRYPLNSDATRLYQNDLQVKGLLESVVARVRAEMDLEAARLEAIHAVDIRCRETGGLSATYNSIVDKHADKAAAADENEASENNAGTQ